MPHHLRSRERKENPQAQMRKSSACHCLPWWISPQPPTTKEPARRDQAGIGQPGAVVKEGQESDGDIWAERHWLLGIYLERGQRSQGYLLYDLKHIVCLLWATHIGL